MRPYPLDVFLPAAGFGERLRPATNHLPKPLLPILGTPIIEVILGKLAAVCDGTIGINLHWKADLLRAWAAASPWHERIVFFPEDPILGTGRAQERGVPPVTPGVHGPQLGHPAGHRLRPARRGASGLGQ